MTNDDEYSFIEHFLALLLLITNDETSSLIEKELKNKEEKKMMTRADIIQIIFGIHSDEMDTIKDLLREDCDFDESKIPPSHIRFWIDTMSEDEWEDCVRRFTILYNTYRLGHNRGYLEGEKRQHELEKEDKNND
jgi:hypothetical protein